MVSISGSIRSMQRRRRRKRMAARVRRDAHKLASDARGGAADLAGFAGVASKTLADDIADRLRHSEALAQAQAAGSDLASRAGQRWRSAELDAKVAELAERVRRSEAARAAAGRSRAVTDASLGTVGHWLSDTEGGREITKRMGLRPRRRWPFALAALVGTAAGVAIGRSMRSTSEPALPDELATAVEDVGASAAAAGTVALDTVRAALASDPRTVALDELDINVAEGTVFVRGTLPAETDAEAVRDVIAAVPGVHDVDLQVAAG